MPPSKRKANGKSNVENATVMSRQHGNAAHNLLLLLLPSPILPMTTWQWRTVQWTASKHEIGPSSFVGMTFGLCHVRCHLRRYHRRSHRGLWLGW